MQHFQLLSWFLCEKDATNKITSQRDISPWSFYGPQGVSATLTFGEAPHRQRFVKQWLGMRNWASIWYAIRASISALRVIFSKPVLRLFSPDVVHPNRNTASAWDDRLRCISSGQVVELTGTRPLFRCFDSISAQGNIQSLSSMEVLRGIGDVMVLITLSREGAIIIGEVIFVCSRSGGIPQAPAREFPSTLMTNDWLPFVPNPHRYFDPALLPDLCRHVERSRRWELESCVTMEWKEQNSASDWSDTSSIIFEELGYYGTRTQEDELVT
ncbi:hypothetical protein M405DRAFT_883375 [Rhizopogon salebrosus TDB-379]|nr:hypothetical protein M405DRAFT_883375 [Rhizopogon salebrosus TDB-379]